MPRKAREKEGSLTTISTKLGDQVLLQIEGRRRIYHTYNAISARNMATMQTSVLVQTRGSMKPQLLMLMKTLLTRRQGMMIVRSSSSKIMI